MSEVHHVEKLAYTIEEAVAATPFSRSTLYRFMSAGELKTRKKHGRRYIMREDLEALLRSGVENGGDASGAAA